eukprot:COSAG05_NODE_277_length_12336_cov_419.763668_2_plen_64_part_00
MDLRDSLLNAASPSVDAMQGAQLGMPTATAAGASPRPAGRGAAPPPWAARRGCAPALRLRALL